MKRFWFTSHGTTKGYLYYSYDLRNIRKFRRPADQAARLRNSYFWELQTG